MAEWSNTRFRENSNEEWLERLTPEFPYQCSRVCLNRRNVFWHWHGAVELFYMESGALTYYTPQGRVFFPEGSGGLINSDVLHRTTPQSREQRTMQLLHLFDASLLADHPGGRIMRRYILPLISPFAPGGAGALSGESRPRGDAREAARVVRAFGGRARL